jgi:hypothetical protein
MSSFGGAAGVVEGTTKKISVAMTKDFDPPPGGYTFWTTGCASPWLT